MLHVIRKLRKETLPEYAKLKQSVVVAELRLL